MIRILLVLAAAAAAVVPTPRTWVEYGYSRAFYPALERRLTPVTNLTPFALFDPLVLVASAALIVRWTRRVAGARGGRRLRAALMVGWEGVVVAAVLYLLFLSLWGLNYRRVPLRERVMFDAGQVNADALAGLGGEVVTRVNELHARARDAGWNEGPADGLPAHEFLDRLGPAFAEVQRELVPNSDRFEPAVPGVPKRSLLTWYFSRAGIDGMTNPYLLEVLINREVLPFEEPMVVAHEWAHLAGYADESEASFVGWLTCVRGDPRAQYSAWLFLYPYAVGGVDPTTRQALESRLADGPRQDLRAIAARLGRAIPVVRAGAERVYDRYLKANRVREGIESYEVVVTLLLGSRFEPDWKPVMRK